MVSGSPRDYRDAHPATALLVMEVADTTLEFDRDRKGGLYAQAGIVDYRIVNLTDRLLEVYRDPTPNASARYGWEYRTWRRFGSSDSVRPLVPQTSVAVADLLP